MLQKLVGVDIQPRKGQIGCEAGGALRLKTRHDKEMNHQPIIFAAGLFFLASACATSSHELSGSSEAAPAKVAKNTSQDKLKVEDEVVCENEMTVGSHIPETVCRAKNQSERYRTEIQNALEVTRGNPAAPQGVGGGR
jgi:starvation-inducible outer membrane lipoprotein